MQRYYKEYTFWEDYKNGMYLTENSECKEKIQMSISLLCNETLFLKICKEVVLNWVVSSKVNLTNKNSNRQAWLGQASCSYLYGCTELQTRQAWSLMSDIEREKANIIAEKIIKNFEINYENKNYKLC